MAERRLKHYSPITGRLELCNSAQGKCPYGAHFTDDIKGQAYADMMNEKKAEREKYLETKEPTYAPRKESLMNEISFSIEDNLDDNQDNFINEQITKRKEFEQRIRDIQNGKEERKVIDDPDGYSVSVSTNLKEEEIEFYGKRADNIAMERYLRNITTGYDSANNDNEDEYLTKDVLKKRLDAEKTHIGNSMTTNLKKLLNNNGNPIVFSNNTKLERNHLDKNDKDAVSIETVRNLNTISKALKSMGYDNNMPKMADMTLSVERIRLKRDGFENEQMKVTVQKNGAIKIKFKNKDAVHAMNRFSKDLLNESDYEIKDNNPIKDKNDYNNIINKNKNSIKEKESNFYEYAGKGDRDFHELTSIQRDLEKDKKELEKAERYAKREDGYMDDEDKEVKEKVNQLLNDSYRQQVNQNKEFIKYMKDQTAYKHNYNNITPENTSMDILKSNKDRWVEAKKEVDQMRYYANQTAENTDNNKILAELKNQADKRYDFEDDINEYLESFKKYEEKYGTIE